MMVPRVKSVKKSLASLAFLLLIPLSMPPVSADSALSDKHRSIDGLLKDNLYLHGVALNFPGEHYLEVGEKLVRYNALIGNKSGQNETDQRDSWETGNAPKFKSINDYLPENGSLLHFNRYIEKDASAYTLEQITPCRNYPVNGCLATLNARQPIINALMKSNETLLQRFKTLREESEHNTVLIPDTPIALAYIPFNNHQLMIDLFHLELSNMALDFSRHRSANPQQNALHTLQSLDHFIELLTQSKQSPLLVDLMVSVSLRQSLDQTLDALLSENALDPILNDPVLETIFELQERLDILETLTKAIAFELTERARYETEFWSTALFDPISDGMDEDTLKTMTLEALFALQKPKIEELIELIGTPNTFDVELLQRKNEATHALRDMLDMIEMFEKSPLYETLKTMPFSSARAYYFDEVNEYIALLNHDSLLNPTDKMIALQTRLNSPFDQRYYTQLIVQHNYHKLLRLKYLIAKNRIQDRDIEAFLKREKRRAVNSITNEPFIWDPKTRTISTDNLTDPSLLPSPLNKSESALGELQITLPEVKRSGTNRRR